MVSLSRQQLVSLSKASCHNILDLQIDYCLDLRGCRILQFGGINTKIQASDSDRDCYSYSLVSEVSKGTIY